jgi:drug/metabolite transporter (DMT)-like permease
MSWILLTLFAAFVWAIADIICKHVVSDELKDPVLSAVIGGMVIFIIFGAVYFLFGNSGIPSSNIIIIAIFSGVFYSIAILLFYKTLMHEEVSRVIPMTKTEPLFVLLLATIFLGEVFTPLKYIGIFLLVSGAILISFKKLGQFKIRGALWMALITAMAYATRTVLFKYANTFAETTSLLLWVAIGGLSASLVLFAFHHPRILKKFKRGIEHLVLVGCLTAAGFLIFVMAMSQAPVSLVSSLVCVQLLFVFIIASMFTKIKPEIVREELKESTIILKIIAIVIIIAGAVLISL